MRPGERPPGGACLTQKDSDSCGLSESNAPFLQREAVLMREHPEEMRLKVAAPRQQGALFSFLCGGRRVRVVWICVFTAVILRLAGSAHKL